MNNEPPKLYTSNELIAAEWRKLYPGIEIVITPKRCLTTTKQGILKRKGEK